MTNVGWDIGGVNTKVACSLDGGVVAARSIPFEIQRAPETLPDVLAEACRDLVGDVPVSAHAVTMTAELSQWFRTKREGVAFVTAAVERAFPGADIRIFAVDGRWLSPAEARAEPLAVAASNWAATARVVARAHPLALLVDMGTTTTDIIPIVCGAEAARGRTDPERLRWSELVYTGAIRTPVEAIVREVPLDGGLAGVSAEGFALSGDVHLWLGHLSSADYSSPTPDGRPATREFAGERLARVVCADREMITESELDAIARHVDAAQIEQLCSAISRVLECNPSIRLAVVTGLGAGLAARAARDAGLPVLRLSDSLGEDAARAAPAAAVALLLAESRAAEVVPAAEGR